MPISGTTLTDTFRNRVFKSAKQTVFKRKVNGVWEDLSFEEYYKFVREIALALLESGIQKGDPIAILSNSRVEWAFADLAILSCGAVSIPIYQSNTASDIEYLLNHSETKILFLENEVQLKKIEPIQSKLRTLKQMVIFDPPATACAAISLEAFCRIGQAHPEVNSVRFFDELLLSHKPSDTATIVYTSGTTGQPKGVVLTHENLLSAVQDAAHSFDLRSSDTILSFLPFAHIFARMELYLGLVIGWTHAFAEGIPKLLENLSEIRPTFMIAVPRIYEKVYNKIIGQVESGSAVRKKIFYWSLRVGHLVSQKKQKNIPLSPWDYLRYQMAKTLVFRKLKSKFGGRLRFFISGGAPLSKEISEFFHAAGFLILEGYGLTETSAASVVNREDQYEFGTVGLPLGDVRIKIAEDGEILIKSKKVFKEYYKDPQATAQALKDGWFHTGDIGHMTPQGMLKITDRKKDLIVTSGGKNIAPQKIENLLKMSRFVSQAMVYGDKRQYLTALITLNVEEVELYLKIQVPGACLTDLPKHPEVIKLIAKEIEEKNKTLASFETIKRFHILEHDFSIETGELTPSLKVKRKYCNEKYQKELQSMYAV